MAVVEGHASVGGVAVNTGTIPTKEVGKGTGLGLATVYGIVQQSGGHIDVQSEPGRGTTFRIWFPRVEEQPAEPVREPASPPRRAPGNEVVLLVEDERPVRTLARRILESGGFEVLEADSGERALAICQRHDGPIHLLVTDMVMPGMNGRDLAQLAAECRPEMKILYMSGYMDEMLGSITPQAPGARDAVFGEAVFAGRDGAEGAAALGPTGGGGGEGGDGGEVKGRRGTRFRGG